MLAQGLLFPLGAAAYLWFLGSQRGFVAEAERLSSVVLGAGVTWIGINMTAQAFQVGLAMNPMAAALVGTTNALFTTAALALAVMLAAVAMTSLRHGAFPGWLGWQAAAASTSHLVLWLGTAVDGGPLAPDGWLSYSLYPVFLLWLVSASVTMIRVLGRRSAGEASAQPPA